MNIRSRILPAILSFSLACMLVPHAGITFALAEESQESGLAESTDGMANLTDASESLTDASAGEMDGVADQSDDETAELSDDGAELSLGGSEDADGNETIPEDAAGTSDIPESEDESDEDTISEGDESSEPDENSDSQVTNDAEGGAVSSDDETVEPITTDEESDDAEDDVLDNTDEKTDEADQEEEAESEEKESEEETSEDDEPITYVEGTDENDGDIALRVQAAKGWKRLWGQNAYDTMQAVLQAGGVFPDKRGGAVVLATGDGYWDALAASGLAGLLDAPIVITPGKSLCSQARSELKRLKPDKVYVMGGTAAITSKTVEQVKIALPKASIKRVYGQTAIETAIEAYEAVEGWGTTALVACSNGYWDALSAAPYAYAKHAPIFLANSSPDSSKRKLCSAALKAIKNGGFTRVVIVGGTAAVSSDVESQLASIGIADNKILRKAGSDAIATSAIFAKWELAQGLKLTNLTVATSAGYWDALSASSLVGQLNSVLVLVGKTGDYRALDAVYDYASSDVDLGYIIGGPAAIPKFAANRIMAEWTLTGMSLSDSCVRKGSAFTATVSGSAVPSNTKYAWSWLNSSAKQSGNWGTTGTTASRTCKLNTPGVYTITATAVDPNGKASEVSSSVVVYGLQGIHLSAASGDGYNVTPEMGVSTSEISGVEYRYTWSHASSGSSGVIKDWSGSSSASFSASSLGSKSGTYKITVEARDADGSMGTKSTNIELDAMSRKAQSFYSPTGYLIMVDCYNNWVGIYEGSQGNWHRIRYMRCSSGAPETPTIKGTFSVGAKGYVFGYGYSCYYYTEIYGDYLFHSVIYDQGTFNIQDGRLGMSLSHGCVRLDINDAKWIWDNMPYGTTIHTYA